MIQSEKEKMLSGKYYNAGDVELIQRWHLAKKLMKEYNQADSANKEQLDSILTRLLGSKGNNVWITAPFFVDYGDNIHIGNNVEINMNCVFLDCNKITIGDNSGIGPNVQLYAVGHPVDPQERLSYSNNEAFNSWKTFSAPIAIGSNVWIGGGSIVLQGVSIGDNTTIAAGSIVTESIPANSLAMGSPCKVVRKL